VSCEARFPILPSVRWPLVVLLTACGSDPAGTVHFDLEGELADDTFWNLPFPSDLRLAPSGAPDMAGFPNPRDVPILRGLLSNVDERRGWPTMPAAYFRFTAPIPERDLSEVIEFSADAPVLLLDTDPTSPEFGTRFPVVARTLVEDAYTSSNVVALAPYPGIVLRPNTRYAYVIRQSFAPGFAAPDAFTTLRDGGTPAGARAADAVALYDPLWHGLDEWRIDDALVATVFTTGDEVARLHARTEAIRTASPVSIDNLALVGGDTLEGFCQLSGTVTMPQFQVGEQPFSSDGKFVVDGNDVPQPQSEMVVPVTLTIPKQAMPAGGWPVFQFFHGSGGLSTGLVDLGYSPTSADLPEAGKGPGFVVARHGIAAVSAAMPVNPERLPGAAETEYLNINNLAAFPYTFQQGVIEQRLLTDAVVALEIPAATLAGCTVPAPAGGSHRFDATKLTAGGQSMGGMYTNMVSAVEPRFGAIVPTGAGGFWNLMILETEIVPGARDILSAALSIDDRELTFVHPALDIMALGWEIAEPMAYMARVSRRPLEGFPVRHVYEPVGKDDVYFPIAVYDAAALAYGNQQAGDELWPTMQQALATDSLDGLIQYPVAGNLDGATRVVVQYESDGLIDSHYIYRQLDAVKHQYGCFLASYLRDGVPTVPAPGALTDPCP
jgi:hypothetical protein